ncbi:MAG: UDP-N-acetylglucosamine 2-epimerase (non-hydrolyzing) [Proteobacteria bacterium]|nr:UDP-N-acetylglucosamine 2-epimerase (non-hydrolyzing) [Pseudomonadota bacterium]
MRVVSIGGARPNFIKIAPVANAIDAANHGTTSTPEYLEHTVVHTGQHYDDVMSSVFFEQLGVPPPITDLGVKEDTHGAMTGRMLARMERFLLDHRPDLVLVYGDTNSTLAGALAAAKLDIPVGHVESGLRSFNRRMPEEINRVVTDHLSTVLFCPTRRAVDNLAAEGLRTGVHLVGDVMYDVLLTYRHLALTRSDILNHLGLPAGGFAVATCHRAGNTDQSERLAQILDGLAAIAQETRVVFPMHPRTRKRVTEGGLWDRLGQVMVVEPVSYLDMIRLQEAATVVITDSGGMQKEAFFLGRPCLTIRDDTEWPETLTGGANRLVQADRESIAAAYAAAAGTSVPKSDVFGDGDAAQRIVRLVVDQTWRR